MIRLLGRREQGPSLLAALLNSWPNFSSDHDRAERRPHSRGTMGRHSHGFDAGWWMILLLYPDMRWLHILAASPHGD